MGEDFLAVGTLPAVRAAIDRAAGEGDALADADAYRRAAEDRPAERSLDAYASAEGVRTVLAPRTGALGLLGALLDRPGLSAAGAAVSAEDEGLRANVRAVGGAPRGAGFSPVLLERVPEAAAAYAGARNGPRLAQLADALGGAGALTALRAALPRLAGVDLDRDLLAPLEGEVALSVTTAAAAVGGEDPAAARTGGAPILTLKARTRNPEATAAALGRLQDPLAARLALPGTLPAFRAQRIGGLDAFTLRVTPELAPSYAVSGDQVDRLHRARRAAPPARHAGERSRVPNDDRRGSGSGRVDTLLGLAPAPGARRADRAGGRSRLCERARRPRSRPRARRRRHIRPSPFNRHDRGAVPRDPMSQYSDNEYLFTSESVTEGHPDKVADQISDGVLDAVLRDDPYGRVACETLVNTGLVVVSGEISTETWVDIQEVARETIRKIGYTDADLGFSADACAVINAIDKQSPDIAQGVDQAYEARTDASDDDALDVAGAGDQGMMFGYAARETDELMPLPISLAHRLAHRLADVRRADVVPYLRPDGKTQVSVRYRDGKPVEIEKLLISTQHREGAESLIPDDLWEHVVEPILPKDLYDARKLRKNFLVNPTGRFVIGGPVGDAGLTGRKIIVDTYGGMARHGGGAFSGKDPSKVDRSAAYAARYVAKNVVAAGLADRCELQVAYAIGVAHPVSVSVETFGTEKIGRGRIQELIDEHFDLRPGRVPELPQSAPPDLPEDCGLRPLRPRGPRLHVGADGQGRGAARGGRPGRRSARRLSAARAQESATLERRPPRVVAHRRWR